ncbi:uncharacterized protein LOC114276252 [Camellia sinensis]|uniref:uncharacterized protein LOC114276252 n=1 Tax=Camellia sinensis TaxID=4442 RepID=UPI0010361648|nr:uncharacterized protein LOC114276252 [Camellia sinensis]
MRTGMDGRILLVCSYGLVNVFIRLHQDSSFVKIVDDICGKFDGLVPGVMCMLFDFLGYKKFKVDSDDDIQNMLCLAKSFGINHIDVLIQKSSVGVGRNCGVLGYTKDGGISQHVSRNGCVNDKMDLLPTYCLNKSKTFLSAQWAYGITHVGQCFNGGATEFHEVLCKYAVERGFQFKYIKNDYVQIIVVCKFVASTDCSWSVHSRMLLSSGVLCIKRFDSVHTCGAVVRTCRNPHTGSDLVSTVVVDRVRDQPLTRPTDVVFDLKNEYGLDISYRVAWLGVEKARAEVYGDHATSFDQLRYFISFRTYIDGFNHCRPLLFLDGTFLKGRFKSNLLAATAKDANQGLFPIAFAIVDSENSANWEWFLRNLKEVVGGGRTLTFISDRHVGLLHSMPIIFPSVHHAYCLLHLQMNLRDRMKYVNASHKIGLMRKLRECAYAPTVTCFNEKLEVLKKANPAVIEDFMKDLHPKHWCNAHFRYFTGRRYGKICSSVAESFNNWVGEAQHLPITRLVDMIRGQIMEQMSDRRVKCTKWASVICSKMEKKLVAAYNDSRAWCVSQANDDVYEVHSHPSWQINGFPCSHAVVAFRNSGRNIYDSIDSAFCIDTFQAIYSGTIYPIPTVDRPTFNPTECLIALLTAKRPPGQPKRKRISSKGEAVQRIRCGRCGKLGNHNRKTYKEPL